MQASWYPMNARRVGIGVTTGPGCARTSVTDSARLANPSPVPADRAMTSKTIGSAHSQSGRSIAPATEGRVRSWPTAGREGLQRLFNDLLADRVGRLVVPHKARRLRVGAELVLAICEAQPVEVGIRNPGEATTVAEALAQDVREIITVLSARLYSRRSRQNHKWLAGVTHAVEKASS
jgi:hypothetical protein